MANTYMERDALDRVMLRGFGRDYQMMWRRIFDAAPNSFGARLATYSPIREEMQEKHTLLFAAMTPKTEIDIRATVLQMHMRILYLCAKVHAHRHKKGRYPLSFDAMKLDEALTVDLLTNQQLLFGGASIASAALNDNAA